MDCIWIWNIHNCKQGSILLNIVILGLTYMGIIIILLSFTLFKFYKKDKIKMLGKFNIGLLFSFILRELYLFFLYINVNSILFFSIFQEFFWITFIGTYNILLHDMVHLLLYEDKYINKLYKRKIEFKDNNIYLSYILYFMTFILSLISGTLLNNKNENGYIFLGLQFIFWGIHIFYIGSFFILFLYKYNEQLNLNIKNKNIMNEKSILAIKKVKMLNIVVIPNVLIFPSLWIYQGIYMYIMHKMNDFNVIFISLFWYWLAISLGSTISCILLIIHTKNIE